ncbi:MAG: lipopolysaccharide biosynthesis protein [Phycisphaerales bacterium]
MTPSPDHSALDPSPDASLRRDPLSTAGVERDLHGHSVRGGAIVMLGQGGSVLLGIVSAAVLARLLDPEDFGLVAMASAFVALLGEFADLGLSQATIQRREVSAAQVNALFWVNAAAGAIAMALGAAAAWPIAIFYGDERLAWIAAALSAGFLLSGIAAQPLAVLRRRMGFTAETIVTLASIAMGLVAAIAAALAGLGYWSLVVQVLVAAAVRMIGLFIASGWMPGMPARAEGVRGMLRFGGYLSGSNLLAALLRASDKVLVGRFVGADAAGLYSNAQKILLVPATQLNKPLTMVGRPALSRLQDEPERFRAFYRRGVELVAATSLPAIAWMTIVAEDLVLLVLGREWSGSVPIFQALAPAALLGALGVVTSWIYVPLGRTDRQFRWILFQTIMLVVAMAVGVRWDAVGVALAYSGTLLVLRPFAIAWCLKGTFVRWSDVGGAVWRGVVATAVAASASIAVMPRVSELPTSPVRLAASLAVFAAAFMLGWIVVPGGLARLHAMGSMVRHLRPGGAVQRESA